MSTITYGARQYQNRLVEFTFIPNSDRFDGLSMTLNRGQSRNRTTYVLVVLPEAAKHYIENCVSLLSLGIGAFPSTN